MANTPKKMKDPTEAALSAIQDALNVRDPEPATDAAAAALLRRRPRIIFRMSPLPSRRGAHDRSATRDDDLRRRSSHASRMSARMRRPANDDRESIGQILRSIQRRPARTSYLVATVFAVVWVLAGIAARLDVSSRPEGVARPERAERADPGRAGR